MTTAQERIAIAIGNFAHAMETNNAELRQETREELHALFAELAAERDAVTRHRDELLAICRRDSEAAHDAVLSGRADKLKFGAMIVRDAVAELVEQRDAAVAQCSFLDQLPKGPALGRFSASERAELDELKRKAFKAGEP